MRNLKTMTLIYQNSIPLIRFLDSTLIQNLSPLEIRLKKITMQEDNLHITLQAKLILFYLTPLGLSLAILSAYLF